MELSFAIHQSTARTARILGLDRRGLIKEGYFADLVLIDMDRYIDKATFDAPYELAEGVEYVFVNGQLALEKGEFTGKFGGKALRLN